MTRITLTLAATLIAGSALAQTTRPTAGNGAPGAASNAPMSGVSSSTGVTPGTGVVDRNTGTAAASSDRNQAVATTGANAPQPARGANSFSQGVAALTKDNGGVWRGTATKEGRPAQVWLDYKGNVGQDGAMVRTMSVPGSASSGVGIRNLDGIMGNQPGTAAGRALDRTLGTDATGTNPNGSSAVAPR